MFGGNKKRTSYTTSYLAFTISATYVDATNPQNIENAITPKVLPKYVVSITTTASFSS